MSPQKKSKRRLSTEIIKTLNPIKGDLDKLKVNPFNAIDGAKNKLSNLYTNFKKDREKEKIRLEKKRYQEEKKELKNKKREEQKERLNKIREEKKQILAQKKLIIDNEKQVKKNEEKRKSKTGKN